MVKEWSLNDIEDKHQEKKLAALKSRLGKPPSWWPKTQLTCKITEQEVDTYIPNQTAAIRNIDQRNDAQMYINQEISINLC